MTFTGDVERHHPPWVTLARDTGLLVHDMALPERDVSHCHLHATPSEVGCHAAEVDCRQLLLTHVMPDLEGEQENAEHLVTGAFPGEVTWARDSTRYFVGPS